MNQEQELPIQDHEPEKADTLSIEEIERIITSEIVISDGQRVLIDPVTTLPPGFFASSFREIPFRDQIKGQDIFPDGSVRKHMFELFEWDGQEVILSAPFEHVVVMMLVLDEALRTKISVPQSSVYLFTRINEKLKTKLNEEVLQTAQRNNLKEYEQLIEEKAKTEKLLDKHVTLVKEYSTEIEKLLLPIHDLIDILTEYERVSHLSFRLEELFATYDHFQDEKDPQERIKTIISLLKQVHFLLPTMSRRDFTNGFEDIMSQISAEEFSFSHEHELQQLMEKLNKLVLITSDLYAKYVRAQALIFEALDLVKVFVQLVEDQKDLVKKMLEKEDRSQ